jgi:hypothetical protein
MDPKERLCDVYVQLGIEPNTFIFSIGPRGSQHEIFTLSTADLRELTKQFRRIMLESHGPDSKS